MANNDVNLRLYGMVPNTGNLGPGRRFAIWFQGCPFDCPGCIAPDSRPFDQGRDMSLAELCTRVGKEPGICGVTVSGGEPFAQARALRYLLEYCRGRGLGTIVFSGFRLEQLRRVAKRNRHVSVSLALTDVLIDGLFRKAESVCDGMRGSANQRIHFLSEHYVDQRDKIERYDRGVYKSRTVLVTACLWAYPIRN